MLEVKDGKIYVEGVETNDPELIGFAFMDFAEGLFNKRSLDCRLDLTEDNNKIEFIGISSTYKQN